jgi:hypothetical protein
MFIGLSLAITQPRGGGGGAAAFDPSPYATGDWAWFRPALGNVFQDTAGTTPSVLADPVGRVNDKSGNGHNILQATSTARPILRNTGGRYWLEFDGVDDFLASAGFTLAPPLTVYARFELIVAGPGSATLFDGLTVNSARIYNDAATDFQLFAGAGGPQSGNIGTGTFVSMASVFNGGSSVIQVGATSGATANPGAVDPNGITLGSYANGGGGFANVGVAELIVYAGAHDAATRLAINTGIAT